MSNLLAQTADLPWGQFGLAGSVIGALFITLGIFAKFHFEAINKAQTAEDARDERWRNTVENGRKESLATFKEINEKSNAQMKETSDKFLSLHEKMYDEMRNRQH